jgi:hypothetical protein
MGGVIMKVKKIITCVVAVLFLITLFPIVSDALGDKYIASLSKVIGSDVQIERDDEFIQIKIGMMLYPDDTIETGWDSGAVIYFSEFQRIKEVDERESIEVGELYDDLKKEMKEERLREDIENLKEDIKGESTESSGRESKTRERRKKVFKRKRLNFDR